MSGRARATRRPCSPSSVPRSIRSSGSTELAARAREALAAAGYADRVQVHVGDGTQGLPDEAPFAAIAVAAAAPVVPPVLYDQLADCGRLVVPVGSRPDQLLVAVVRSPEGPAALPGIPCRFVPLVGADGF